MKLSIFGTGYVGLVSGACLAEVGHHVVCMDVDPIKIDNLMAGILPIWEPGLDALVERNVKERRLCFTTDAAQAVEHGQVQFIAVGTPQDEDGSADMQYVLAVVESIATHMSGYRVIVNKSTVPVGTASQVQVRVDMIMAKRGAAFEFDIVSNPEFLKEGAAVNDFLKPDRIIIGTDSKRAVALMQELYEPFNRNHDRTILMDVRSAELTKYAANAMLATKISFMNEMANMAEHLGADIEQVRKGIGADPRIGYQFIYPGCGYGGSCFPKDVQALAHGTTNGLRRPVAASRGGGEQPPESNFVCQARPPLWWCGTVARQNHRRMGPGIQTQYRRHACGTEPHLDGSPVASGRRSTGV